MPPLLVFVGASAYSDVGTDGGIPAGWYRWVRPDSRVGEIDLVLGNSCIMSFVPGGEPEQKGIMTFPRATPVFPAPQGRR